jgi:hypothetical protein
MTTATANDQSLDRRAAASSDVDEVRDTLAIQKLLARYCYYVDTFQAEPWVQLWTEDGEFDETETGTGFHRGRDTLRAFFGWIEDTMKQHVHFGGPQIIDVLSTTEAKGITYSIVEGYTKDGSTVRATIYYQDDYRKVDGEWLFARRKIFNLLPPVMGNISHD